MNIFFYGLILLFLSGFISDLFKNKKLIVLSILSGIGAVLCSMPAINVLLGAEIPSFTFDFNNIFGPVCFEIDALSAFFIVVISIMTFVSIVYSKGYLQSYLDCGKEINAHIIFLPVLIASMLAVVAVKNALMFLIFWEIMSLSSFFLVIFENEKKEVRRAGIKYLVFMHVSVLFIILAFLLASIESGSFDFNSFKNVFENNNALANLVFILSFIGFGTKAGFFPFHNWLPSAHPEAPSHVSAMMSGVMIKTGIYGILRMVALSGTPSKAVAYFVLIISVISALYGVLYAIAQHDIKRLLAYHSIENIGIIGIGIGVGMLGLAYNNNFVAIAGFTGSILHVLNHSIFKELLFLSAGNVYTKTHTKNVEALGGLIKSMPNTAALFLIGSVAICGLPPFNGFISEFLIYIGMFQGLCLNSFFAMTVLLFSVAGLALVGTMAVLCFTKAFSVIFLGAPRSSNAKDIKKDVYPSMIFSGWFLACLTLFIGVLPQFVFPYVQKAASVLVQTESRAEGFYISNILDILQTVSIYALCLILFIVLLCILKYVLYKGRISYHTTWGCGYNKPNNNMQYTASSYASPFLSALKPLFKRIIDIEKPRILFPKRAHFSLRIEDLEEACVINPLIKLDEKFLSKFETLQSGNIQSYIKYGLIFLVFAIVGSLFL